MYLVTGSTGNVGSNVVDQLLSQGLPVRVFTRDPAKVAPWRGRVQIAHGDLTQPGTFTAAVSSVAGIFLMNGALDIALFRQLLAIAKASGTPRVVFLSTVSAADPGSPIGRLHKEKEDALQASGIPLALVRAGGFMSNAFQWIPSIQAEGVVPNALGAGRFAPIAPEDIAAVAVYALTAPFLNQSLFEVTGASLITLPEQVGILSRLLGKPLRSVDVPIEAAIQNLIRTGLPPQVAAAVGQSLAAIREGRGALVTDTVERVTGRPPR
ncbi:MAG: NAD(P)H-binding protein, partial [Acidobacteriaceae bacterium]